MTDIRNQTVLVTGSSRGLGKAFVRELLDRGAKKIYATARDPHTVTVNDPRVVTLPLDVADPESMHGLADQVGDLTMLINNAGIYVGASLLGGDLAEVRREFETNFYGPLNVTRALAPIIVGNGGGAILNVHSVLSWIALGGSYSAGKAALWSATNSMRLELTPKHVQVVGLHVGYIDTDMAAAVDQPKISAAEVVRLALDGLESGAFEVLADQTTRGVKAGLGAEITALYPQLQQAS